MVGFDCQFLDFDDFFVVYFVKVVVKYCGVLVEDVYVVFVDGVVVGDYVVVEWVFFIEIEVGVVVFGQCVQFDE